MRTSSWHFRPVQASFAVTLAAIFTSGLRVFAWQRPAQTAPYSSARTAGYAYNRRMCGRFALTHTRASLEEWADAVFIPCYDARYNIAPGSTIVAIRNTPEGRVGSLMRWGLIPAWAKDPAAMPMLHNARAETVAEKPMFRQAFRRRRCLIPASGFYEWKAVPGQKLKQPFYISLKNNEPMAFAGLWESAAKSAKIATKNATTSAVENTAESAARIASRSASDMADESPPDTCTILTTEANAVLAPIHHRMPLLLEREDWEAWLSAETDAEILLSALNKPVRADRLQTWGVAHAVNRTGNDNPTLVLPIPQTAQLMGI